MKTLYLDCGMGAAGDMLSAALIELTDDKQAFINQINALGIPGVRVCAEKAEKCGIVGTHYSVRVDGAEEESEDEHEHHHEHEHEHDHEHEHHHEHEHEHEYEHHHDHEHEHEHAHRHSSVADIGALIEGLPLSDRVRADAKAVYGIIAEAESRVHGRPVSEIHFHEVGTMDAVADVVSVCLLMEKLSVDEVIASPVHVGSGHVHCMHGVLPVPAPATALILKDVPCYGGRIRGELCTPTGAALLKHFVTRFGDMPVMRTQRVGYGMGKKDFEWANCLRAFLGESEGKREGIARLECNVDDMTGEEIGFAMDMLFKAGACDVYTQPVGMKKSRPGVMLSVICLPGDADRLAGVMMKHTSTLGVRREDLSRYVLDRSLETVQTPCGPARIKTAAGMGVKRSKVEYDDAAALAEKSGSTLREAAHWVFSQKALSEKK